MWFASLEVTKDDLTQGTTGRGMAECLYTTRRVRKAAWKRRDVSHWNLHLGEWLGLWLGVTALPFPCSAPGVLTASPPPLGSGTHPATQTPFLEAVPQISTEELHHPFFSRLRGPWSHVVSWLQGAG